VLDRRAALVLPVVASGRSVSGRMVRRRLAVRGRRTTPVGRSVLASAAAAPRFVVPVPRPASARSVLDPMVPRRSAAGDPTVAATAPSDRPTIAEGVRARRAAATTAP
jgi:hypothetical protein